MLHHRAISGLWATQPPEYPKSPGNICAKQVQWFRLFEGKVTQGCRDPICERLRASQCHLEPSWTPWQSRVVQHHSSSSCGQKPLTPWQTEGNEKKVAQPMALYFICRETWLILQLCGHCLLNANNMAAECRADKKRGFHGTAVAVKLKTSPEEDLEAMACLHGSEFKRLRTHGWLSDWYWIDEVKHNLVSYCK